MPRREEQEQKGKRGDRDHPQLHCTASRTPGPLARTPGPRPVRAARTGSKSHSGPAPGPPPGTASQSGSPGAGRQGQSLLPGRPRSLPARRRWRRSSRSGWRAPDAGSRMPAPPRRRSALPSLPRCTRPPTGPSGLSPGFPRADQGRQPGRCHAVTHRSHAIPAPFRKRYGAGLLSVPATAKLIPGAGQLGTMREKHPGTAPHKQSRRGRGRAGQAAGGGRAGRLRSTGPGPSAPR